jgi:hypothetical protein
VCPAPGGDLGGLGGSSPYLPKINGYALNYFSIFGTNNEEEKGRKMKTREISFLSLCC